MNARTVKTDEFTIKSGYFKVGDKHKIWFEQWGNKDTKIPILTFHGGPGGEFKPHHKYSFDPKRHQVIGFDQRGSGNSLPYGEINHNTTQDLISDAIKILEHLGITKVHLSGGSWGSTLALLFAEQYPELVESIIVRGVFLGTEKEINWLGKGHFRNHYPEVWENFVSSVPAAYKNKPAQYHYKILAGNDSELIENSARALENLEVPIMLFDWQGFPPEIKKDADPHTPEPIYDAVPYKIYGHYFKNLCFLENDYILNNVHKIKAPLYIVQGRYDMACPPITAYTLHKAVPQSKLFMTLGSHGNDPETRTAMKTLIETIY